jgi:rfaE bifunctional protein kinase chain/domain
MQPIPSMALDRARSILREGVSQRVLVVGDIMLDQFVWGRVSRISPEAPVPVLEFQDEHYMPGGGANVARNLTAWGIKTEIFSIIGQDSAGDQLVDQLQQWSVGCDGVLRSTHRMTGLKTRFVAQRQQMVRVDREQKEPISCEETHDLLERIEQHLTPEVSSVILCDYGKGVVTQPLLDRMTTLCRERGIWLSMDPKPVKPLNLKGLSLMTPNRKELFALTRRQEVPGADDPLQDPVLLEVIGQLMNEASPAMMLVTLGERGMLLCQRDCKPFHVPTMAREVYDVSGAGDTAIAAFTVAVAGGASPVEAAILANHAAGVVVGKSGTAIHTIDEWLESVGGHD